MISAEMIDKFVDAAGKFASSIFVMVCFVLFIPEDVGNSLDVSNFKYVYRGYLWLAFVFTGSLTLIKFLIYIDNRFIEGWLAERRRAKNKSLHLMERENEIRFRLSSLNERELLWIKYCLYYNVQTLSARVDDVTAQSLVDKRLLSQGSGSILNLPYHIPDDVWLFVRTNQELIFGQDDINDPNFKIYINNFKGSLQRRF